MPLAEDQLIRFDPPIQPLTLDELRAEIVADLMLSYWSTGDWSYHPDPNSPHYPEYDKYLHEGAFEEGYPIDPAVITYLDNLDKWQNIRASYIDTLFSEGWFNTQTKLINIKFAGK